MSMSSDERKLQPVFDDINARRFKIAESTIARHLKKTPKSQTALVARFVLYHEQNSPGSLVLQALAVARRLGELSPGNFWRLERALKEMRRWDLVLAINQESADRNPDSEQHTAQLHLCAVACWDTEVMAKTSRKLFNSTKDVAWARRAAWSEWAKNAPQPTRSSPIPAPAPTGSLKVASLLLSTTSRNPQTAAPTSDILWLHMQILLSAGDNKKAHEYLVEHGRNGGLARDWYRMQGVQEIGRREAEGKGEESVDWVWVWETELTGFLNYWTTDSLARRNYAYYRHSILAAKALLQAKTKTKPDLVEKLRDTFISLDKEIGEKERAPRLARLELDLILVKSVKSSGGIDLALSRQEWEEMVMSYWNRWGSKGSIIPELEGIVSEGEGDRKEWFRSVIESRIAQGHSDESTYRQLVNAHCYLLRGHDTAWQPTEEDIKTLWKVYIESLVYGKNLSDKDIQPADQIGLAAVQLILYTPGQQAAHRAITCLEYILSKSPACAHAKFLLVRLYRLIGTPRLATPHLDSLGLSEIQLDTLMHIWLEGGSTDAWIMHDKTGWFDRIKPITKMYNASGVHLPENLRQAISLESYSKIHSIRDLAHTQICSRTRATLSLETSRHPTKSSPSQNQSPNENENEGGSATKLKAEQVVDTRNWELMPSTGGNRPKIQDLSHLRLNEDTPEGLLVKIALERAFAQFLAGEEGESKLELETLGSNDSDRAFYAALNLLLKRVGSKSDSEAGSSVDTLYDGIKSVSLEGSRWSVYNQVVNILKLFDSVSAVISKIRSESKKKVKSPIVDELGTANKSLVKSLEGVLGKLDDLKAADSKIDLETIMHDMMEDDEFVRSRQEAMQKERLSGLQCLESEIKRIIASIQTS